MSLSRFGSVVVALAAAVALTVPVQAAPVDAQGTSSWRLVRVPNPTADQHFWPYGLNQNGEFSQTNADRHVKIVEAMARDGL
jgi:hypothetical protein